jgi:NitT/TauT family transport system permease protein
VSALPTAPPRPSIWCIAGRLSRAQYWAFAAIGLLLPFLGWLLLSASGWIDPVFLPGPLAVFERLAYWLFEDELIKDTGISLYRVMAGFALSAVLALPLGLLIGAFRPVEALLEPLTDFIRYMPAVAFIPLVMLWVGIDESSKIAIIWIGTFFQMVLMFAEDVRRVPMTQIEAALVETRQTAADFEAAVDVARQPLVADRVRSAVVAEDIAVRTRAAGDRVIAKSGVECLVGR